MPPARWLLVTALLVTTACSRRTERESTSRVLATIDSEGTSAELTTRQATVDSSAGLQSSGRWFGWERASTGQFWEVQLRARAGAGELARELASQRCASTEACASALARQDAALCARAGVVVVALGKGRTALVPFDGHLYEVELEASQRPCDAVLAGLPPIPDLIARSGTSPACLALLGAKLAGPATECVLRRGLGSSLGVEGQVRQVEEAIAGGADDNPAFRFLGAVGRGSHESPDYEAALYAALLRPPEGAMHDVVRFALAYAPSPERRRQYLEAVRRGCRDASFPPAATAFAALAAGQGNPDEARAVQERCGVAAVEPPAWYRSWVVPSVQALRRGP